MPGLLLHRRDLFGAAALASASAILNPKAHAARATPRARRCILVLLLGGPSHLETFDPKPEAPTQVRGPFRSIPTSVPGIRLGEHLPRLAQQAGQFALVRGVHHDAAPIHETGLQLLQTGGLASSDQRPTHIGLLLSSTAPTPLHLTPAPLRSVGLNLPTGQDFAASNSVRFHPNPAQTLPGSARQAYGNTRFGDSCLQARRLLEDGATFVTVNMFDSFLEPPTWDCHAEAQGLTSTLEDYRRTLCPALDQGLARLLQDLRQGGLLDETLVLAMGEMGRTPYLNARGGRDHWTRCWSILAAGAGIRGGQTIGASDHLGGEPTARPVRCEEIAACVLQALGLPAPFFGESPALPELWT